MLHNQRVRSPMKLRAALRSRVHRARGYRVMRRRPVDAPSPSRPRTRRSRRAHEAPWHGDSPTDNSRPRTNAAPAGTMSASPIDTRRRSVCCGWSQRSMEGHLPYWASTETQSKSCARIRSRHVSGLPCTREKEPTDEAAGSRDSGTCCRRVEGVLLPGWPRSWPSGGE